MPPKRGRRREPRPDRELPDHITSLVLRRLPAGITFDRLVYILNETVPGRYNFLHLPHDHQSGQNVALAFVNFVDHDAAAMAFRTRLVLPNGRNTLGQTRVTAGRIQGLGNNLAYFIARFGHRALGRLHPPKVFLGGEQRPITAELLGKFVDFKMLQEARSQVEEANDVRIDDEWDWILAGGAVGASGSSSLVLDATTASSQARRQDESTKTSSRSDPQSSEAPRMPSDSSTPGLPRLVSDSSSSGQLPVIAFKDESDSAESCSQLATDEDQFLQQISQFEEGGQRVFEL